jgi:glycosyltransferase involved in cell wall biosynthesis
MVRQTVKPLRWVVVSDGSTDATNQVVQAYADRHDWIRLLQLPQQRERNFAGKVTAFNAGYDTVRHLTFDIIGNLDGDVSFDDDYLAFLVSKFAQNPRLGVAGTPYREENPIHDDRFKSPTHVSGACQLFRRDCFEAIGGYRPVKSGGIDLIALLAAQAKGWQTQRFDARSCQHHRSVGGGQHANVWRRLLNLGAKDYLLGSHPFFELFRCASQMLRRPYLAGGALMLTGYTWAMLRRMERSMPEDLIEIRQRDQLQRLRVFLKHPLKHLFGPASVATQS